MSIPKLITFAKGGHSVHFPDCIQHGYEDPETFLKEYHWWTDPPGKTRRYTDGMTIPEEGVPVLDKREALETPRGLRFAMEGPMPNANLPAGSVQLTAPVNSMLASAMADNIYGTLLRMHHKHGEESPNTPGPLDFVSADLYLEGWKSIGARTGRLLVKDGNAQIAWDCPA